MIAAVVGRADGYEQTAVRLVGCRGRQVAAAVVPIKVEGAVGKLLGGNLAVDVVGVSRLVAAAVPVGLRISGLIVCPAFDAVVGVSGRLQIAFGIVAVLR